PFACTGHTAVPFWSEMAEVGATSPARVAFTPARGAIVSASHRCTDRDGSACCNSTRGSSVFGPIDPSNISDPDVSGLTDHESLPGDTAWSDPSSSVIAIGVPLE